MSDYAVACGQQENNYKVLSIDKKKGKSGRKKKGKLYNGEYYKYDTRV